MPEPTTHKLDVPGAVLTYDVRGGQSGSNEPPLVLIAAPMGAAGFTTLASHFSDRIVVTYDPRGVERSERTDGAANGQMALPNPRPTSTPTTCIGSSRRWRPARWICSPAAAGP